MNNHDETTGTPWSRRQFLTHTALAAATAGLTGCVSSNLTNPGARTPAKSPRGPVKAFCIDFNWGDHA